MYPLFLIPPHCFHQAFPRARPERWVEGRAVTVAYYWGRLIRSEFRQWQHRAPSVSFLCRVVEAFIAGLCGRRLDELRSWLPRASSLRVVRFGLRRTEDTNIEV